MRIILFFIFTISLSHLFSQSVGIGTTTPALGYILDVNGNLTTKGVRLTGLGNYFHMVDGTNSNKLFRWAATGGYLRQAYNVLSPVSTKNYMVIDSTGKVGIGENNPSAWLDVNNVNTGQLAKFNGGTTMWVTLAENGTNRGYIGSFLGNAEDVDFSTYGGNTTGSVHLGTNGTQRLTVLSNGDILMKNLSNQFKLRLQSNAADFKAIKFESQTGFEQHSIESYNGQMNFRRNENLLASMVWSATDRFGIGQIAPLAKLHVSGGSDASLTSNGFIMTGESSGNNVIIDDNEILGRNDGAGGDLFIQNDAGNILLCAQEVGAVGIGIAAASGLPAGSLLAVDGKITCEEVLVKMSQNWPDYVFADEYILPDLCDVKTFIEENNHLPGIPKAIDIEKDGLEVGAIQRKMMEKIEELTLYVIMLKEEIEALKKK
jgi:hypothetical protein